jgi:hypothetical protein
VNSVRFARKNTDPDNDWSRTNDTVYAILAIENNSNQFVKNMFLVLTPASGSSFVTSSGKNGMSISKSFVLSRYS